MLIDRRYNLPPVEVQQGGSCVGASGRAIVKDVLGKDISSLWLYEQAQTMDEWPGEDYSGTSIVAALRALEENGYELEYEQLTPHVNIIHNALTYGSLWAVIFIADDFTYRPYNDRTASFSNVDSFKSGNIRKHAVCIVGETVTSWVIRNSWGTKWGANGYCHISKGIFNEIVESIYQVKKSERKKVRKKKLLPFIIGGSIAGISLLGYLLWK